MRPIGIDNSEIEAVADVTAGMFVAAVEDRDYYAATVIRIGGPAVRAAELSHIAARTGELDLAGFLIPDDETPGMYTIAEGVTVSFRNPFDSGARKVTSPKLRELWPPQTS